MPIPARVGASVLGVHGWERAGRWVFREIGGCARARAFGGVDGCMAWSGWVGVVYGWGEGGWMDKDINCAWGEVRNLVVGGCGWGLCTWL